MAPAALAIAAAQRLGQTHALVADRARDPARGHEQALAQLGRELRQEAAIDGDRLEHAQAGVELDPELGCVRHAEELP